MQYLENNLTFFRDRPEVPYKNLNKQITKQDMIECKPEEPSNNYLYISGVSVVGLAIVGYFLYDKF